MKKNGQDHFEDPKAYIEYSNDMQDLYKYIDEYNSERKTNILTLSQAGERGLFGPWLGSNF